MEPSSGVSVTGDIYLILGKCKLFGEYILLGAVLHFLKILSVNGMKCWRFIGVKRQTDDHQSFLIFWLRYDSKKKNDGTELQSMPNGVGSTFANCLIRLSPPPLHFVGSVSIQTRSKAVILRLLQIKFRAHVDCLQWMSLRILLRQLKLLGRSQTTVSRSSRLDLEKGFGHSCHSCVTVKS